MELYNVPRNSKIRIVGTPENPPPAHRQFKEGEILNFHHIDGMYSYCTDKDGHVVHLTAWQEVEIVND